MAESAYVACAENISLLHLLHEIPEPPSVNTAPVAFSDAASYSLPFATERSLAGVLAFLSSITDNPNFITAVCVQEGREGADLKVHVAINKKNDKDNNATLETICDGFNRIFLRLSSAMHGMRAGDVVIHWTKQPGTANCENDILTCIVSLCKRRILCRLGYENKTKPNGKCRSPLDLVLDRARQSLLQLRKGVKVPKVEALSWKGWPLQQTNTTIYRFVSRTAQGHS